VCRRERSTPIPTVPCKGEGANSARLRDEPAARKKQKGDSKRVALFHDGRENYFFRTGGKSVHTPSNTSAAIPIDSPSVGCG
jgi:hypothetical protein